MNLYWRSSTRDQLLENRSLATQPSKLESIRIFSSLEWFCRVRTKNTLKSRLSKRIVLEASKPDDKISCLGGR